VWIVVPNQEALELCHLGITRVPYKKDHHQPWAAMYDERFREQSHPISHREINVNIRQGMVTRMDYAEENSAE